MQRSLIALSTNLQALAVIQQADDAHQRRCEPEQHVDKIDPLKLPQLGNISLVWTGVVVVALERSMEPSEDGAPNEEEDPIPDEYNSHVIVGDQCRNKCEGNGRDDAKRSSSDREYGLRI
jgi:hypothetical protein